MAAAHFASLRTLISNKFPLEPCLVLAFPARLLNDHDVLAQDSAAIGQAAGQLQHKDIAVVNLSDSHDQFE